MAEIFCAFVFPPLSTNQPIQRAQACPGLRHTLNSAVTQFLPFFVSITDTNNCCRNSFKSNWFSFQLDFSLFAQQSTSECVCVSVTFNVGEWQQQQQKRTKNDREKSQWHNRTKTKEKSYAICWMLVNRYCYNFECSLLHSSWFDDGNVAFYHCFYVADELRQRHDME